jgi:hypothetical protein
VKREAKPFEFKMDDKGLAVPGFRWKTGEGQDKLKDYASALRKLLAEVESKLK